MSRAYSNSYGVLYKKLIRNDNDVTMWWGCSFQYGATFELAGSEYGSEVSATVRPEFIRLRFAGSADGCNRELVYAGGWSMITGRENQLFLQTCDETSGNRKFKSKRFEKIVQRAD